MMADSSILQFAPFSSAVDAGFWHKFTDLKLDVLHLSEEPVAIMGNYVNSDALGLPTRLNIDYDALESNQNPLKWTCVVPGTLINTNTIEEFKSRDKVEMLKVAATSLWNSMLSEEVLRNPPLLSSFLMFTFADLKKYHYYYWFAFPAFTYPKTIPLVQRPQALSEHFTDEQVTAFLSEYSSQESLVTQGVFAISQSSHGFTFHPLCDYPKLRGSASDVSVINQYV
ncbi:Autophagy protein 7 [Halocaridina rubra]|uniref:Ubiquitin-like modifier-activating enzyme ATG7 n=1 Tax=Halocaridina rubra TaxID=373956 RepID=A0AAN8X8M7_HALRR